jgi:hypothetical protein
MGSDLNMRIGQRRFYSSKTLNDDNLGNKINNVNEDNENLKKVYFNADTSKAVFLGENKGKTGIYR